MPSQAFMKSLENYYEVTLRSMECIKLYLYLEEKRKEKLGQKKKIMETQDQTKSNVVFYKDVIHLNHFPCYLNFKANSIHLINFKWRFIFPHVYFIPISNPGR